MHQLVEYDREKGISYWTKNYRTGIEFDDPEALTRTYPYYDPISTLDEPGRAWWRAHAKELAASARGSEGAPAGAHTVVSRVRPYLRYRPARCRTR